MLINFLDKKIEIFPKSENVIAQNFDTYPGKTVSFYYCIQLLFNLNCLIFSGQTASNLERRLQGQIDTPLNETGELQAKAAGQALKSLKFDKAYSSDLKRAKSTCAFILDANVKSSITSKDIIGNIRVLERQGCGEKNPGKRNQSKFDSSFVFPYFFLKV